MKAVKLVLFVALGVLVPAVVWAAAGDPGTGLIGTAHDFSGNTVTVSMGGTLVTGLCTYCHTPHKAVTTRLLWNHTLSPTNATYKWDTATTMGGTTYPVINRDTYLGPTVKCLSCHDGSVGIGDIAWFGEGAPDTTGATNVQGFLASKTDKMSASHTVGASGNMGNNHPVAMPYPYGGVANTYNGNTTGSGVNLSHFLATPASGIRLFNDSDGKGTITAGAVATKTGIECSSCHDPHNQSTVSGDHFLRGLSGGNTSAYICLKCHTN